MKIAPHLLIQLIFPSKRHVSFEKPEHSQIIMKLYLKNKKILRIRMNTYKKGREETHAGSTLKSK